MRSFKTVEEAKATLGDVDLIPIESVDYGHLSRQMESGGDPSAISSGRGDAGGRSYGSYQIAIQNGTLSDFIQYTKDTNPEAYSRLGSAALSGNLDTEWKRMAQENPQGFHDLQHNFVQDRHYAPLANAVSKMGIDTGSRSSALNNYLFSTAVQMGPGLASRALADALAGTDPRKLSDAQIIDKLAVQKSLLDDKGGLAYWKKSSPGVQRSVLQRIERERDAAFEMLGSEQPAPQDEYSTTSFGRPNENNLQPQVAPQGTASLPDATAQELSKSLTRNPSVSGQDVYERANQSGQQTGPSIAPLQDVAQDIRGGSITENAQDNPDPFGGPGVVTPPPAATAKNPAADVRMSNMLGVPAGDMADQLAGTPVEAGPMTRNHYERVKPVQASPSNAAISKAPEQGFWDSVKTMAQGKMSKDEATTILVLQDELQKRTGQFVPTEEILRHKNDFLRELGWKPYGSTAELMGIPMTMGIVAGLGTNPMTTLAMLSGFEVLTKGKSAAVRSIDPEASHLVDLAIGSGVSSRVRNNLRGMETLAELVIGGKALGGLHRTFTKEAHGIPAERWKMDSGLYFDEWAKTDPQFADIPPDVFAKQREMYVKANPDGTEMVRPAWVEHQEMNPREAWVVIKDKAQALDNLLRESNFWRQLTIPERALVVQDASNAIRGMRKQGMPDQEILKVIGRTFGKDDPAFQKLWEETVVSSGRSTGEGSARPAGPASETQSGPIPQPEAESSPQEIIPSDKTVNVNGPGGTTSYVATRGPGGSPVVAPSAPIVAPTSEGVAPTSAPTPAPSEPIALGEQETPAQDPLGEMGKSPIETPAQAPAQEQPAPKPERKPSGMSHEDALAQIRAEGEHAVDRAHDENPTPEEGLSWRVRENVRMKAEDRALARLLEYQSISQTTHDILQAKLEEERNPEPVKTPPKEPSPAQEQAASETTQSESKGGDVVGGRYPRGAVRSVLKAWEKNPGMDGNRDRVYVVNRALEQHSDVAYEYAHKKDSLVTAIGSSTRGDIEGLHNDLAALWDDPAKFYVEVEHNGKVYRNSEYDTKATQEGTPQRRGTPSERPEPTSTTQSAKVTESATKAPSGENGEPKRVVTSDRNEYKAAMAEYEKYATTQTFKRIDSQRLDEFKAKAPGPRQAESWKIMPVQIDSVDLNGVRTAVTDGSTMIFDNPWPNLRGSMADFAHEMAKPMPVHKWIENATERMESPTHIGTTSSKLGPVAYFGGTGDGFAVAVPVSGLQALKSAGATSLRMPKFEYGKPLEDEYELDFRDILNPAPLIAYKGMTPIGAISPITTVATVASLDKLVDSVGKGPVIEKPSFITKNPVGGGRMNSMSEEPIDLKGQPREESFSVKTPGKQADLMADAVPPGDPDAVYPFTGAKEVGPFTTALREAPLHWMVEQIIDITGNAPRIRGLGPRLRGYFVPKNQEIVINRLLGKAKDRGQILRTLAHEFGHLIDFIPDNKMAGGVLGKMSGLKSYKQQFIARGPWMPGPLTKAEIESMKKEIERAQSTTGERWVDEMITKTVGGTITPDDVLSIWRSATTNHLPAQLVNYVKGLGRAEKKAVMVAAMSGMLPKEIQALAGSITQTVPSGRKIKQTFATTPDPAVVMAELQKRIQAELTKRRLLDKKFITEELKGLSKDWRPWDRSKSSASTITYRDSPQELYADAMSAILNNPEWAVAKAPTFFEGLFNYLSSKPEFYQSYLDLQQGLQTGNVIKDLDAKIRASFRSGDAAKLSSKLQEFRVYMKNSVEYAKMFAWNKFNPTQALVNKRGGDRALKAEVNPMFYLDNMQYTSTIQQDVANTLGEVVGKAVERGISLEDFGAYIMVKAVLGSRGDVISPIGDPEARALIEKYEKDMPGIKDSYREWQAAWRDGFLQKMVDIEYWPEAYITRAAYNPDYARYQYEMFIDAKNGGGGSTSAAIKGLVGSVTLPMNPIPQMVEFATDNIAAAHIARAKKAVFDDAVSLGLAKYAKVEVVGRGLTEFVQPDKGSGLSLVENYWDGKRVGYIMPTPMAWQFEKELRGNWIFSTAAQIQSIFKKAFVHINPNFIFKNPFRDVQATLEHIPLPKGHYGPSFFLEREFAISLGLAAAEMSKTGGLAFAKKAGKILSVLDKMYPGVRQAYDDALTVAGNTPTTKKWLAERGGIIAEGHYADWMGEATGEKTQFEDLMVRYGALPNSKWYMKNPVTRAMYHFLRATEVATQSTEYLTKVAGAIYLKRMRDKGHMPGLTDEQIIHSVRNDVGSPNYLRQPAGRLMINFITMFTGPARTGLMQDYAAWKRDKASYMARKVKYAILPGMVKAALKYSLIGASAAKVITSINFIYPKYSNDDEGKKKAKAEFDGQTIAPNNDGVSLNYVMRGIGESEMLANHIIPLGYTEKGMVVALKIPMTEYPSRLLHNAAYMATSVALSKDVKAGEAIRSVASKTVRDLPGITPPAGVISALSQYYVLNQSPTNGYTNKQYVPDSYMKDGDPRANAMFWSGLMQEYGGVVDMFVGPLIKFKNENPLAIKDEVQDNLRESFVGKLSRPFITVTDQGFREEMQRVADRLGADRRNAQRDGMMAFDKLLRKEETTPTEKDQAMFFANSPAGKAHVRKLIEEAASGPLRGALQSGNKIEDIVVLSNALNNPLLREWAIKYMAVKNAEGK